MPTDLNKCVTTYFDVLSALEHFLSALARSLFISKFSFLNKFWKNEYISKGVSQNCSTALNKHLCECQVRHCSATTVRDMTLIFSSTCRSSRGGGTQTAHEIFIRPLVSSVDGFEVDTFEIFLFIKFLLYLLQKQEFLFLQ